MLFWWAKWRNSFKNWEIFRINNKAIIEFGFRRIWRILQISEGVIHLGLKLRPLWITPSSIYRILHIQRKSNSIIANYYCTAFRRLLCVDTFGEKHPYWKWRWLRCLRQIYTHPAENRRGDSVAIFGAGKNYRLKSCTIKKIDNVFETAIVTLRRTLSNKFISRTSSLQWYTLLLWYLFLQEVERSWKHSSARLINALRFLLDKFSIFSNKLSSRRPFGTEDWVWATLLAPAMLLWMALRHKRLGTSSIGHDIILKIGCLDPPF